MALLSTLCRDCGALGEAPARPQRCRGCGSPRLVAHAELTALSIAHLDCDAFYASVEKRDNPALRDQAGRTAALTAVWPGRALLQRTAVSA